METKNPNDTVIKDLEWLNMEKYCIVSPHSSGGGGLFLAWKNEGLTFHTTFVYGEPDHTKHQAVWSAISELNTKSGEPWFFTGDLNEIIDNGEKEGGPCRPEGTFCSFRTFLSENDPFDLKHSGNFLSWRGQSHAHLVHCRLDRAVSNTEWSDLFPSCRCQYLPFEGSDHHPLLSFLDPARKKRKASIQI